MPRRGVCFVRSPARYFARQLAQMPHQPQGYRRCLSRRSVGRLHSGQLQQALVSEWGRGCENVSRTVGIRAWRVCDHRRLRSRPRHLGRGFPRSPGIHMGTSRESVPFVRRRSRTAVQSIGEHHNSWPNDVSASHNLSIRHSNSDHDQRCDGQRHVQWHVDYLCPAHQRSADHRQKLHDAIHG